MARIAATSGVDGTSAPEDEGLKTHWIALDFLVLVDRSIVQNGEPHKFDDVRWFRIDALPSFVHSQAPKILEKYKHIFLRADEQLKGKVLLNVSEDTNEYNKAAIEESRRRQGFV